MPALVRPRRAYFGGHGGKYAAQLLQAFAQSTEFINDTMAPIATFLTDISSPGTSGQTYPTGSLFIIGLLPSYNDASANWKNAGLAKVGGIQNRTTVCTTVNPLGGGSDDYSDIQNAINSCPAGEVVKLGAGTFNVQLADLPIEIPKGIVLRGADTCPGSSSPYCGSVITVENGILAYTGDRCGVNTSSKSACPNGGPAVIEMTNVSPDYNFSWAQCSNTGSSLSTANRLGCGATPLAADAAQGQTTIQVQSTSNFSVGMWVLIDEASAAGWVNDPITALGQVWATSDFLSSSSSPATGRLAWQKHNPSLSTDDFSSGAYPYQVNTAGCWHSYCDRPISELHLITSIGAGPCPGTNCTLTFDDPLTIAFRESGNHHAQVYTFYTNNTGITPGSFVQNAGLEDVSVTRGPNGGVLMQFCAYCWIKNVEVADWYGGGIDIVYSVRSEIFNTIVQLCWDSVNSGGEYPIALDDASTEILIDNSITSRGGKGMVARAGGAGSVIAYNYQDDTMYDDLSGIGDYWIDMGLNGSHFVGAHHILFEGNWADNCDNDFTHGSDMYHTYFKNWCTGLRTPFVDPSNGLTVNDEEGIGYTTDNTQATPGPLRPAGAMAWDYWMAYVGNVLGISIVTTAANNWVYSASDFAAGQKGEIWLMGWNNWDHTAADPNLSGSTPYMFRHGNYDYYNGAVTWDSGTPDHYLPNSFYLLFAPSFFGAGASCTYPWPWVTPTGWRQIQSNSCSGSGLPAKARYDAGTPFTQP